LKSRSLAAYILAVVFPVLILLSMSFLPVMTYFYGEEILLETTPLDPRDLFRGDYLNLRLAINEVPISLFPEKLRYWATFEEYQDKNLYAILKKEEDYYIIDKISFTRPKDQLYLKAKVDLFQPLNQENYQTVEVNYQLDRYFIPENTGEKIEDLAREGKLIVAVKIWRGYPLISDVFNK